MNDVPSTTTPEGSTLTEQQVGWLAKLDAGILASEKAGELGESQAQGQSLIRSRLEGDSTLIKQTLANVKIEMESRGLGDWLKEKLGFAREVALLDPGRDPMKEFDSWHHGPEAKLLPPETIKKLTKEMEKLHALQRELLELDYYKEPELSDPPTDDELQQMSTAKRRMAEDLWQPMVREGIIPENFVPSDYSEVERTFDAASELYNDRLDEYSKSLSSVDKLLDKFNVGVKVLEGGIKLVGSSIGLTASIGDLTGNGGVCESMEEAKEVLDLFSLAVSSTSSMVNSALKERDVVGVADAIANIVDGAMKAAGVDKDVTSLVSGLISASARTVKIGPMVAEGNLEGAVTLLADAIAKGMKAGDSTDDGKIGSIGDSIALALKGLVAAKAVSNAMKAGKPGEAIALMMGQLGSIFGKVMGETGTLTDEQSGLLDEDIESLDALATGWGAFADTTRGLKKPVDPEVLAKMQMEASRLQAEEMEEFMRREDRSFDEMLAYGFSEATDEGEEIDQAEQKRIESIEHIMAIAARDSAVFDLCKKILTGGPKLVASLVPGVGLAAAVTQLCFSIAEAVKHAEQLVIWLDNVSDAKKASTVQVNAMMNRFKLESKQNVQANIRVAIDAVKVAGEAMKLAGQAAPGGYVLTAAADLAGTVMEVASQVYEAAEMEKAWRTYQKALANPQDRILARKALQQNPTLAKYAMAWGAVEEKNPIAQEAMRRCGLNERTLAQAETNVDKVVAYLEQIYKEDPILLRMVPPKDAWHPGPVEFTFRSWSAFCQKAAAEAKPKVVLGDVSGINAALGQLEKAEVSLNKAVEEAMKANAKMTALEFEESPGDIDPGTLALAVNSAKGCMTALARYTPKGEDGNDHVEMQRYVQAMLAHARMKSMEIEKLVNDKPWLMVAGMGV